MCRSPRILINLSLGLEHTLLTTVYWLCHETAEQPFFKSNLDLLDSGCKEVLYKHVDTGMYTPVLVVSKNPTSCLTIEENKRLRIRMLSLAIAILKTPPRIPAQTALQDRFHSK